MNIRNIVNTPLAMQEDLIPQFLASVSSMPENRQVPTIKAEIVNAISAPSRVSAFVSHEVKPVKGAVAVIPAFGVVAQHRGQGNFADVYSEELVSTVAGALNTPNVGAVVVVFDGPGGLATGCRESFRELYSMRGGKPLIGVVKGDAASATYYLASAFKPLFVQPSGKVGSVGCWMAHLDASEALKNAGLRYTIVSSGKYKTETHSIQPLSKEAKDHLQESVDRFHDEFIADVAKGRGVHESTVREDFGQGRMVNSNTAWGAMMVDGVATMNQVLSSLLPQSQGRSGRARADREPSIEQLAKARTELLRRQLDRAEQWNPDA